MYIKIIGKNAESSGTGIWIINLFDETGELIPLGYSNVVNHNYNARVNEENFEGLFNNGSPSPPYIADRTNIELVLKLDNSVDGISKIICTNWVNTSYRSAGFEIYTSMDNIDYEYQGSKSFSGANDKQSMELNITFNEHKILLLREGESEPRALTQKHGDGKNIIPKMTSNTTPLGYEVKSSSIYSSSYPAYRAFADTGYWASASGGNINQWIEIKFDKAVSVGSVSLTGVSGVGNMPKRFKILASNDGINFIELAEVSNQTGWVSGVQRRFDFLNGSKYLYYRLNLLERNAGSWYSITKIEMGLSGDKAIVKIPSQSEQSFINHGISQSDLVSIDFSSNFTEKHYIQNQSTSLGSGKVFKQPLDVNKIIKSVKIT